MAGEKQFENLIKRWLQTQEIYPLGTEVPHSVGYYEKRWGGGQFTKSGLPDMQIVVKGICVEAEIKATNGKPSPLQIQKIRQVNNSGGIGFILYPKNFNDFKKFIVELKKGNIDHANELFKSRLV